MGHRAGRVVQRGYVDHMCDRKYRQRGLVCGGNRRTAVTLKFDPPRIAVFNCLRFQLKSVAPACRLVLRHRLCDHPEDTPATVMRRLGCDTFVGAKV